MWNPFEQPWSILILSGIVFIGVWLYRAFVPQSSPRLQILVPLAIVALAFAVDFFFKTDNEKIRATIKTSFKAIKNESPDNFAVTLAENYSDSGHRSKADLMKRLDIALNEPTIKSCFYSVDELKIEPQTATAIITVRVFFEEESWIAQSYKEWVIVNCRYQLAGQSDSSWKIDRIEIQKVDAQPFSWSKVPAAW